jgi:hypothetical protein
MAFITATLASDAYSALRSNMPGWKAQAQNALSYIQTNSINSDYVFSLLNNLNGLISSISVASGVSGLNAYATSLGYSGTIVSDAAAVSSAAQACITWVTSNFPKDTGGFIQAYTLNADGTRTAASFTPTQTSGLQTALTSLIATIQ